MTVKKIMNSTRVLVRFLILMHLFVLVLPFCLSAQEYKVASFEVKPNDMTARTNSRVDGNGRKCAVIKVYADDNIAAVRGAAIGEVAGAGMEKLVYIAHDAKAIELVFDHHLPLKIVFDDYGYPTITGQMTYECKLARKDATAFTGTSIQDNISYVATINSRLETHLDTNSLKEKAENEYKNGNYAKALDLFLAIPDDAYAQYKLGIMYEMGYGVNPDDEESVRWYRKAAKQGHIKAQSNLGWMYEHGRGIDTNYDEALHWYLKSANQGYAGAQFRLGVMYRKGSGINKNFQESVKWYELAAKQGHAKAQSELGSMYRLGDGVEQNYDEALKWYLRAAEQNDNVAQCALGRMYEQGQGVRLDYAKAMEWYLKSAEGGNAYALNNIGVLYRHGKGVEKCNSEAAKWYEKAVLKGNALAQYNLGCMYYDGEGVPKNMITAKELLTKSANQGFEPAQKKLTELQW